MDNIVVVSRSADDAAWFIVRTDGGGLSGRDMLELCDSDIGSTRFGVYLRQNVMVRRMDTSLMSDYTREELRLREIVEGELP